MSTVGTLAKHSSALRCLKARIAAAMLCALTTGIATAAEPIRSSTTTHTGQRLPASTDLVEKLIRWGDVTIKSLFPAQVTGGPLNQDDESAIQFDPAHQLFKPVLPDSYNDALKKIENQQYGLQISNNTQFQFDFQRYWTVDDRQEVSVTLGVHFGFR